MRNSDLQICASRRKPIRLRFNLHNVDRGSRADDPPSGEYAVPVGQS